MLVRSVIWFAGAVPLLLLSALAPAFAQFGDVGAAGATPGKEAVLRYEIGMVVTAGAEPCAGIVATVPVPTDWPEQEVTIVKEDFSPYVKHAAYREQTGVKQLVVNMPQIPAGEQARAVITIEVTRSTLVAPDDTSAFVIPKKLDRKTRLYLAASPKIESRNPKIRSQAKEITADHEGAWEKVEAIYDWVREHVKYQDGPLKGALAALNDGTGDCEELTSLFIAMCRATGIPARTVWVPGHCYPEFYLEDEGGHGHWFPCQAAGSRSFGGIEEVRPILQKGDNFTVPEKREKLRYVAEFLTGAGGQPKVKWVRQAVRGPA